MTQPVFAPQRANTILYCRQWSATVAFYRSLLGLPVSFENDRFVEFLLNDGAYLSIADASRASIAAVAGQGITLAWQVRDLAGCTRTWLRQTRQSRGPGTSGVRGSSIVTSRKGIGWSSGRTKLHPTPRRTTWICVPAAQPLCHTGAMNQPGQVKKRS